MFRTSKHIGGMKWWYRRVVGGGLLVEVDDVGAAAKAGGEILSSGLGATSPFLSKLLQPPTASTTPPFQHQSFTTTPPLQLRPCRTHVCDRHLALTTASQSHYTHQRAVSNQTTATHIPGSTTMEDADITNSPPDPSTLPEAGNDPGEPVRPDVDEENATPNPSTAAPGVDMELTEAGQGTGDADAEDKGDGLSDDDNESVLSDVDEAQFEDFDPNAIAIEDRPAIAVDESNVGLIGVHKRKRADGDGEGGKRKKREGRRDKPRKSRKRRGDDDGVSGGEDAPAAGERRSRRSKKVAAAEPMEEDWDSLDPHERRRRALDAKMDEALKGGRKKSRKQQGIVSS